MPTTLHFRTLSLLIVLSVTALAHAQTVIRVPADQPSIQAGIDAAQIGDTVLVAPGTYFEMIDFKGKAITVTSSDGPAHTIIDGSHLVDWIVKFVNGETRSAVLNGFSITNACADSWPVNDPTRNCGGIIVRPGMSGFSSSTNPTITNNVIHHNFGKGILAYFAGALIRGNTVSYTSTQYDPRYDFGCDYSDGNGITIQGGDVVSEIVGNIVEYNTGHAAQGGGIDISGPVTTVSNNIIRYNQAECNGGGIYVYMNNVSIVQNLIYGNIARVAGGGIFLQVGSSSNYSTGPVQVFIVNNTLVANTINPNPSLYRRYFDGSQIAAGAYVSQTGLFNNLLIANDSYSAVYCDATYSYLNATPLVLDHNDIFNSSGSRFGGGVWCQDFTGSNGNIAVDPQFVNAGVGDFHLLAGSPAIDTGDNSVASLPGTDLSGNTRIQRATTASYANVDMGVYEAVPAVPLPETHVAVAVQPIQFYYGAVVTLAATVTAASPVSAGSVGFFDGTAFLGDAPVNVQGVATLMTTAIDAGNRSITASFGGTADLAASTSPAVSVTVTGDATSITLSALPSSPTYSQNIVVTVTVSSALATPTGTVTLYISIAPYATATLNEQGVATFVVPPRLDWAGYLFTAVYSTQSRFAGSKSPNLTVNYQPYATTTILSAVSPPVAAGKSFAVAVGVQTSDGMPPTGSPSGYVTIFDGTLSLSLTFLNQNGDGTVNVPGLSYGSHLLRAAFTPLQPTYASSTSQPLSVIADVVLQLSRPVRSLRGTANTAPISADFAATYPITAKPESRTAEGQFPTPSFFYVPLTTPDASTSSDKPRSDRPRSKRKVRRSPPHTVRPVPSTRSF